MISDALIREYMRMEAEILTLRARVEELERGFFKPDHPTKEERRLMKDAEDLARVIATEHAEVMRLRACVEELERERITDEQLDKAWRCFEAIRGYACCRATLKAALYELRIVACSECGGTGGHTTCSTTVSLVTFHLCPVCSGHGWRRNDE